MTAPPTSATSPAATGTDTEAGSPGGWRLAHRSPARLALLAVAALALFFWLTAPGNRSGADDVFWYADEVEHASWSDAVSGQHLRHLLYIPLGKGLWNGLGAVGLDVSAYDALRALSTVAAAAAVVWFALLVRRRFGASMTAAVAAAIGFGLSYGFWRYANEAEIYALSALLLIALLDVVLAPAVPARRAVLAGALGAAAVLVNVLAVIPVALAVPVWLLRANRRAALAWYGAVVVVLGLAVILVTWRVADTDEGFLAYAVPEQGHEEDLDLGPSALAQDALVSVAGAGQAVVAANFAYAYDDLVDAAERAYPARFTADRRLPADEAGALATVVAPLLLLAFAAAVVFLAVRSWGRPAPTLRVSAPLAPLWVWIGAHWLVTAPLAPQAIESWVLLLLPAWLLAGRAFARAVAGGQARLVAAVVVLLGLQVAAGGLLVEGGSSRDYNVQKGAVLVARSGSGDTVVTADSASFARYVRYHSPATVVDLAELPPEEAGRALEAAIVGGGEVWTTEAVVERLGHPAGQEQEAALRRLAGLPGSFERVADDPFGELYRLGR